MKRHWSYLKYVVRHKWFVFVAGLKTGAPLFSLVIHDWSKFLPSEWCPYAETFYEVDGSKRYHETPEFASAWNLHQKRNAHHWQFWVLYWDRGELEPIAMPSKFVKEMVADWMGAGRAITGRWETKQWYEKNKEKIKLHPTTRKMVEDLLP